MSTQHQGVEIPWQHYFAGQDNFEVFEVSLKFSVSSLKCPNLSIRIQAQYPDVITLAQGELRASIYVYNVDSVIVVCLHVNQQIGKKFKPYPHGPV